MKRRRGIFFVCLAVAVAVLAGWFFRPFSRVDASQVHPRLGSLQEPFQLVNTTYFMDGGTIGIDIVDAKGATESFCFPSPGYYGTGSEYTRLYVGSVFPDAPGNIEITGPEHTKRRLVDILKDYPEKGQTQEIVLAQLSERPVDAVPLFLTNAAARLKRLFGFL